MRELALTTRGLWDDASLGAVIFSDLGNVRYSAGTGRFCVAL